MTFSEVAIRMRHELRKVEEGSEAPVWFDFDGRRVRLGGRNYRSGAVPSTAVFVITHPHRPSLASCEELVREQRARQCRVAYDAEKWIHDHLVDEQAYCGLARWEVEMHGGELVVVDQHAEAEARELVAA